VGGWVDGWMDFNIKCVITWHKILKHTETI